MKEHKKLDANGCALKSEAKLLRTLQHPNIVQLIDFGLGTRGKVRMVTEYCSGGNLASILNRVKNGFVSNLMASDKLIHA